MLMLIYFIKFYLGLVFVAFIIARPTGYVVYIHRKLMDMNVYSSIEIKGTNTKSYIFITKGEVSKERLCTIVEHVKPWEEIIPLNTPKRFVPSPK
jgi:hypothetical protein